MKYIYYYTWVSMAFFHKSFSKLFLAVISGLVNLGWISIKKKEQWKKNYNEGYLEFLGGITDWEAFGVMIGIYLIPLIVLTVKYRIDIYTKKLPFFGISVILIGFCYYWIYYRSIKWLTDNIKEISKKYYI